MKADGFPELATARPCARDGLASVFLDDEIVLYDETTTTLHHLNVAATLVWQQCDGRRTIEDIVETIAAGTVTEVEAVRRDVEDVVRRLVAASLLVVEDVTS